MRALTVVASALFGIGLFAMPVAGRDQKAEFTAVELTRLLNEAGSVALYGIVFDAGAATIKSESAITLAPIGELLKAQASLKLEIQCHTDNVGSAATNLKLSQDRAAAVKEYLLQAFAIAPARLSVVGLGDTMPVGDNTTEAGRAKNRRIALVKK